MIRDTLNYGNLLVRLLLTICLILPLAITPLSAKAFDLEQSLRDVATGQYDGQYDGPYDRISRDYRIAQNNGGMTLSQAIEKVRRDTGGQIVSAETKVSNGRETHHVKVLTKDGKVKTVKVPGRTVSGG